MDKSQIAEKLSGFNWRNGESVWKALHLPNFTNDFNVDVTWLGAYPWVFVILGWSTIIIELFYPLFSIVFHYIHHGFL